MSSFFKSATTLCLKSTRIQIGLIREKSIWLRESLRMELRILPVAALKRGMRNNLILSLTDSMHSTSKVSNWRLRRINTKETLIMNAHSSQSSSRRTTHCWTLKKCLKCQTTTGPTSWPSCSKTMSGTVCPSVCSSIPWSLTVA